MTSSKMEAGSNSSAFCHRHNRGSKGHPILLPQNPILSSKYVTSLFPEASPHFIIKNESLIPFWCEFDKKVIVSVSFVGMTTSRQNNRLKFFCLNCILHKVHKVSLCHFTWCMIQQQTSPVLFPEVITYPCPNPVNLLYVWSFIQQISKTSRCLLWTQCTWNKIYISPATLSFYFP